MIKIHEINQDLSYSKFRLGIFVDFFPNYKIHLMFEIKSTRLNLDLVLKTPRYLCLGHFFIESKVYLLKFNLPGQI